MKVLFSLLAVATIAILLGRSLKLSKKYERSPHQLSEWNSLDQGIDPTEEDK